MCRKSPAVSFVQHRFQTTSRCELLNEIQDAPLKDKDRDLVVKFLEGYSYKELAIHFNLSESRISKWKRSVFERLFVYWRSKH